MAHKCPIDPCPRSVPTEMLMCKEHWFKVPQDLRRQVWAVYKAGDRRALREINSVAIAVVREETAIA